MSRSPRSGPRCWPAPTPTTSPVSKPRPVRTYQHERRARANRELMSESDAPTLLITGGRLLDPDTGRSEPADLLLSGGRVTAVAGPGELDHALEGIGEHEVIDATDR